MKPGDSQQIRIHISNHLAFQLELLEIRANISFADKKLRQSNNS